MLFAALPSLNECEHCGSAHRKLLRGKNETITLINLIIYIAVFMCVNAKALLIFPVPRYGFRMYLMKWKGLHPILCVKLLSPSIYVYHERDDHQLALLIRVLL